MNLQLVVGDNTNNGELSLNRLSSIGTDESLTVKLRVNPICTRGQ
jgi:hypothetical protein